MHSFAKDKKKGIPSSVVCFKNNKSYSRKNYMNARISHQGTITKIPNPFCKVSKPFVFLGDNMDYNVHYSTNKNGNWDDSFEKSLKKKCFVIRRTPPVSYNSKKIITELRRKYLNIKRKIKSLNGNGTERNYNHSQRQRSLFSLVMGIDYDSFFYSNLRDEHGKIALTNKKIKLLIDERKSLRELEKELKKMESCKDLYIISGYDERSFKVKWIKRGSKKKKRRKIKQKNIIKNNRWRIEI